MIAKNSILERDGREIKQRLSHSILNVNLTLPQNTCKACQYFFLFSKFDRFQRPAVIVPDLESKPVWSTDDEALTNHTEGFVELEASAKTILTQAHPITFEFGPLFL